MADEWQCRVLNPEISLKDHAFDRWVYETNPLSPDQLPFPDSTPLMALG